MFLCFHQVQSFWAFDLAESNQRFLLSKVQLLGEFPAGNNHEAGLSFQYSFSPW